MVPELFEQLLREEESTTLDFKEQQYPFAKASDDDKSELLKDILGFANAWKRSDAFILIGIKDVRGDRSKVVGIDEHLDDHSLQQFVKSKTNNPVRFHYEAFGFEAKQVGIIRIEKDQPRPIYLKSKFGKLEKDKVYIRRGSSTDPSKPANLEEIALMGKSTLPESANIEVEFADLVKEQSLGTSVIWETEFAEMLPAEQVPKFGQGASTGLLAGINLSSLLNTSHDQVNPNYYHDLMYYIFVHKFFRETRLLIENRGEFAANKVRCEIEIPADSGLAVMSEPPATPWQRKSLLADIGPIRTIQETLNRQPGIVQNKRNQHRFKIEIDCGDMQPGRRIWSEEILVAAKESGDHQIAGIIFAENLPRPKTFVLSIQALVNRSRISLRDLMTTPPPSLYDKLRLEQETKLR